jgi:hypothetical protein
VLDGVASFQAPLRVLDISNFWPSRDMAMNMVTRLQLATKSRMIGRRRVVCAMYTKQSGKKNAFNGRCWKGYE